MNIGLDMMGGDFSPLEAVKGIQLYLKDAPGPAVLWLVGDENQIRPLLEEYAIPAASVRVVHASQVIGMDEHPTRALKEKQQSSIAVGYHLLATGKMDAFISAGNTGAMLVGALFSLKPIEALGGEPGLPCTRNALDARLNSHPRFRVGPVLMCSTIMRIWSLRGRLLRTPSDRD